MISINSLTVAFGGFTLLDNINFHISENDKIGLVGKNGAGKSTLLKLICGEQTPTSGKVEVPGGMTIGYLPQIMQHHRGRTVLEEALTAFSKLFEMEAQLEAINVELAERTDYESEAYSNLIVRMNELNDHLAVLRSDDPNVLAERTLKGLGFKTEELSRPTETFSQGWNMRIELAKILLGSPDILLLDEPTNHLDIESIEWLESNLKEYKGSLVLISHDRKFLDNVTNRTVEIMLGHIHDYKVPYSQYQVLRAERIAQQRAAYENQQRMIEKTEEFIERFRYKPTKSNQVQSRVKALEKLERIEVDIEDKAAMTVKFPPASRSGDIVFKAVDLVAGYPSPKPGDKPKVVFSDAQIEVMRGEKVALVGRNGEGKTTLMRILMRELDPLDGEAKTGYNVNIGYYAQNQEDVLDKQDTVFGTLDRIAVGDIRTKLRDILAAFLFKGEDIDKKVAVLSGGERARLAMAKLMLTPYNLLALDEPTNHMDILSKDILKQALQRYDGTLIIVSHDRDFLEGLVDKVYEFRDGRVKEHLGGIDEFLRSRKIASLSELERKDASKSGATSSERKDGGKAAAGSERKDDSKQGAAGSERKDKQAGQNQTAGKGQQAQQASGQQASAPAHQAGAQTGHPKFLSKEQRKIKNRVDFLEKSIAALEAAQKEIETHLQAPGPDDDIIELTRKYLENKREIDNQTDEWLELSQQL